MDAEELERVFRIQVWLRALKHCYGCDQDLPVSEFRGYGRSFCRPCERVRQQSRPAVLSAA